MIKGERECDEERILKSMVAQSRCSPFSIHILFSFSMMFPRYGEIRENPGHYFIWFVLEMTADSSSLRDFLLCMGLIRVAWEKNWMRVEALTWGRKGFFDPHLFWLIVCVRRFFFLDCFGFRRCNLYCNICMRWCICLRERRFVCCSVLRCLWCFNGLWCELCDWYS